MQISSRIDLQVFCQCNDSKSMLSKVRRVDQTERVAKFEEEKLTIDLFKIKGRSRQSA